MTKHRIKKTGTGRGTKAKPVDVSVQPIDGRKTAENPEIRRAAERAGLVKHQLDITQTALAVYREKGLRNDSIGYLLRAEAKRMREEATKIDPQSMLGPDDDAAEALAFMKDKIVSVTDLLGESMASLEEQKDRETFYPATILENLRAAHLALWNVRWECYVGAGRVKHAPREQAKGGAS